METTMTRHSRRPHWIAGCVSLALLCATCGVALAQDAADKATGDADAALKARLAAELRATVSMLAESGAFGDVPVDRAQLDVSVPAQRMSDLGLLVDSASAHRDGVHVLGVTPGEQAQKMGVRGGDLIVAAGGESLTQREHAAAELRRIVDALPDRAELSLDVVRDGRTQTLRGTVTSRWLPPMRLILGNAPSSNAAGADTPARDPDACGRISDFDVAPRQQQLHAARVLGIDGKAAGPAESHVFRVTAGMHTLEVGERIDARYLPFNDRQRRAGSPTGTKTLRVDVPADTTLLVAARLNADKQREWQHAAYWDPVVWKTADERCR